MTVVYDDYIMYSKTMEAYKIKTLMDILCNTVKQSFFNINSNGIDMTMFDQFRNILVSFKLTNDGFNVFKFNDPDNNGVVNVSFTTSHLYKMLKTCKKKDCLELCILKNKPYELVIRTRPRDQNRVTVSVIHTSLSPNIHIEKPVFDNCNSVIIPSADFCKIMKDISLVGSDTITISTVENTVKFEANADGILKRSIIYGNDESTDYTYTGSFSHDRLSKIIKIAALGDVVQFYTQDERNPLKIKSRIGDIGVLELYIKSNDIIASER